MAYHNRFRARIKYIKIVFDIQQFIDKALETKKNEEYDCYKLFVKQDLKLFDNTKKCCHRNLKKIVMKH